MRELLSDDDVKAILATGVPQYNVVDRIVWAKSTDGIYSVKTGYKVWHDQTAEYSGCIHSGGCSRLWRLSIPYKIKISVWRFCIDNIPVCIRLKNKGVVVSIICLICNVDIKHFLHLFFGCPFAESYWHAADLNYNIKMKRIVDKKMSRREIRKTED